MKLFLTITLSLLFNLKVFALYAEIPIDEIVGEKYLCDFEDYLERFSGSNVLINEVDNKISLMRVNTETNSAFPHTVYRNFNITAKTPTSTYFDLLWTEQAGLYTSAYFCGRVDIKTDKLRTFFYFSENANHDFTMTKCVARLRLTSPYHAWAINCKKI